ncbi:uncharacterized protein A4U43_C03F19000 [Asparagus officinalis]|uniref:ubiquitinyl hydrolase 1 n=1 Tax=Asparagus officinalis TaxID=4686 RepID=A0A5P1FGE4_ASPOF|nr:ubiquitin carboxyl-terminal hydrolase 17-like [Asparagus officinalis]ONK75640.1 uncharacterized protein A4U43_C03F19000 [Asparagus officinalis]
MPGGADLGFVAVAVVVGRRDLRSWVEGNGGWRWRGGRRSGGWLGWQPRRRPGPRPTAAALAYMVPPFAPSPEVDDEGADAGREIRVGDWAMPPSPAQVLPPQCAVCYRHTTTRCSRCKAVRYCSGKCQIIHWRQGHKDECHPPNIDGHNNGGESVSNFKCLQTNQSDLSENIADIGTKTQPKQPKASSARPSPASHSPPVVCNEDHIEVKSFIDVPETESNSESFADTSSSSSSSCSTFSGLFETSDDSSVNDVPPVLHSGKMQKRSCNEVLPEGHITEIHTFKASPKRDPPANAGVPMNNLSCTSNIEQKVHSSKTCDGECTSGSLGSSSIGSGNHTKTRHPEGSVDTKDDHVQTVAPSSCGTVSKSLPSEKRSEGEDSSCRITPPEGIAQPGHRCSAASVTDKSSSIADGKSTDVWLLKSKNLRTPASSSYVDHESSDGAKHAVSRVIKAKNECAPALAVKPVEATVFVPNGISDIKTSVRRVVQQFKSSNLSKHSSGARSDISRKYKMLFPYDLFVKLYNDKVEIRPCGLTNCGNSCYANAVLQCLAFTRPLTSYLLKGLHADICPRRDWCFTCEFASLLVKAKKGQSPLSPIGILSHIDNIGSNLGHGKEEDAHEFLRYAIDTMQSVCLKEAGVKAAGTKVEETTLVHLIFGGYLRSRIKCTRCRGKSERQEQMMDLTVEIHGGIGTLEEALARFTATEILDGENKYHCNRCKSYERAKKKLTILEAPNVLTIALKRFQSGKFGKLNKAVRFPEILDLAPYMSETDDKSPVYSLYAVVVHQDIMNAAFSGHYICYVKSTQGKWYKTDDSKVKPVELASVLTKNAYILFYSRCSPRAPSLIRSTVSHDPSKSKRTKGSQSITQQRSYDHPPPYRSHTHHLSSFQPSDIFNGSRLPFSRTDSSSDNSSLLSGSDEGSCSTDSTRESTSSTTEELSEYIFGGSGRFSMNSSVFSEDSDGFMSSPLVARHNFAGESDGLSYGERLGWERREVEGRESPQFLYSDDSSSECRKLTGDFRGRWVNEQEPNVLTRRSSTSREGRTQPFY